VRNIVVSLKILIKAEFYKTFVNLKVVQGQNKHNSENQMKSLVEKYMSIIVLVYKKKPNNSGHLVHYLPE